jgi:hypothetical protein
MAVPLMFGSHGANVGAGTTCATVDSVANTSACLTTGFAADNHTLVFGPVPAGVVIANLSVVTSAVLTAGTGVVVTVLDNGATTALTCTIPTGGSSCTNNAASVSIPAGDFLQVQIAASAGTNGVAYAVTFM